MPDDRLIEVELRDTHDRLEFTLVAPPQADMRKRRVSVLTPLGLSFVGKTVGDMVQLPIAIGQWNAALLRDARPCQASANNETSLPFAAR